MRGRHLLHRQLQISKSRCRRWQRCLNVSRPGTSRALLFEMFFECGRLSASSIFIRQTWKPTLKNAIHRVPTSVRCRQHHEAAGGLTELVPPSTPPPPTVVAAVSSEAATEAGRVLYGICGVHAVPSCFMCCLHVCHWHCRMVMTWMKFAPFLYQAVIDGAQHKQLATRITQEMEANKNMIYCKRLGRSCAHVQSTPS